MKGEGGWGTGQTPQIQWTVLHVGMGKLQIRQQFLRVSKLSTSFSEGELSIYDTYQQAGRGVETETHAQPWRQTGRYLCSHHSQLLENYKQIMTKYQ